MKKQTQKVQDILQELYSGFYGFWVVRWRVTFLLVVLILLVGGFSLVTIPKESNPDIEFWVISITTPYIWVNPIDVDNLVTQKIEQDIKDIEWIKKITSSSTLGISSIAVELETDAETASVLVDVKDAVDKVVLPSDTEDPIVTAITSENTLMFDAVLYADSELYSQDYLREKAIKIQNELEWQWAITQIDIAWGNEYDVLVLVDQKKLESIGLSIFQVSQAISAFNKNQPIGNYEIGNRTYDFRIDWELDSFAELLEIALPAQWWFVALKEVATLSVDYTDDRLAWYGAYQESGYTFVSMTFNKEEGKSIFDSSADAKDRLETVLNREEFAGINLQYTQDLSVVIQEDYASLASNWWVTILLVFLCLFFFVGLKESVIASITIPLAFLITFFVLNQLGLSLNFLTNFSLIITFGIAIDVTIVIVEWAHEKMRLGFEPKEAVLLAVRDYKWPLIAGTSTTLAAFLPLLSLPGVTWKFLAYIPITIFSTLLAALFISLTINSALYFKLSSKKDYYTKDEEDEKYMPEDEIILLKEQRKWKEAHSVDTLNWRDRMLITTSKYYAQLLRNMLSTWLKRALLIVVPIWLLILSFMLPIGFEFFPAWDNPTINIEVLGEKWFKKEIFTDYIDGVDAVLSDVREVKLYSYRIEDNIFDITVELRSKDERKEFDWRDSFSVEEEIFDRLAYLQSYGFRVATKVQRWGPPAIKPVWVKLVAQTTDDLSSLIAVAWDFEKKLLETVGTKNVSLSSENSPGQFVFNFDNDVLNQLGLTPSDLMTEIFATIQGIWAWTIKGQYDDHDIKVQYEKYVNSVSPSDIENLLIQTKVGQIRVGDVLDYSLDKAIDSVQREDTQILIRAEADVVQWVRADQLQSSFIEFAESYEYPDGISFETSWENAENADIIQATWVAGLIALILIYSILVLQFNSFSQPAIIMYSVIMGLLGANVGLYLTGNMYSMAFGIGFIALTWIVVNDAIVFIDRINKNVRKWMSKIAAVEEAGKARLHPIILTTITTILWLMSVALEDEFFAGLAYTIMFGLFVGSLSTLYVVPAIYLDKKRVFKFLGYFLGWIIGLLIIVNIVRGLLG